jgi:5,10-methylenetetrahydromethanopterin reductase
MLHHARSRGASKPRNVNLHACFRCYDPPKSPTRFTEDPLYSTAWACGCVLADGEPADSPRAVAQAGPRAAVLLHRAADLDMEGWQNTSPVPPSVAEQIAGYVEMARGFQPQDARYLANHRGHFVFVKPDEKKFVTAELIRRTTFTATEQELKQRVEAVRAAGWSQLVIPITLGEERAIEDWARIKRAFD